MNSALLLILAFLSRDRGRNRFDRFRLAEEIKLFDPALSIAQVWGLVDLFERREKHESGPRELLPVLAATLAGQAQTSTPTSTTSAPATTTTTTTGIDPTTLIALALLSQGGDGW